MGFRHLLVVVLLGACTAVSPSGSDGGASSSGAPPSSHRHGTSAAPSSSAAGGSSGATTSGTSGSNPRVWRCPGALNAASLPFQSPQYAVEDLFEAPLTNADTAPYGYLFPGGHILRIRLTAPTAAAYRVSVAFSGTAPTAQNTPRIWPLRACEEGLASLVAPPVKSGEAVMLEAQQTVDLIIHVADAPAFTQVAWVNLGAPCVPSCGTQQCGVDACGITCGTCSGMDFCDQLTSTCVDVPGQACGDALTVDAANLPYTHAQLARLFGDDGLGACNGSLTSPELVYSFTPTVTGVYPITVRALDGTVTGAFIYPDVVVARDCLRACHTQVAGTGGRFQLNAGETYSLIVHAIPAGPVVDQRVELTVGQPCLQQCDGRDCGSDGCGTTCGSCDAAALMECHEATGTCQHINALCSVDLSGPCNLDGYVCDPAACRNTCEPVCFLRSCELNGGPDTQWVSREVYAPSSCVLAGCPNLPLAIPFDYASDFTSASFVVPLDELTGQCQAQGAPSLVFGFNAQHPRYVNSVVPWSLVSASSGTLYRTGSFDTLLDFADGPVNVRVRAPNGRMFDVEFIWAAHVVLRSITRVPG